MQFGLSLIEYQLEFFMHTMESNQPVIARFEEGDGIKATEVISHITHRRHPTIVSEVEAALKVEEKPPVNSTRASKTVQKGDNNWRDEISRGTKLRNNKKKYSS